MPTQSAETGRLNGSLPSTGRKWRVLLELCVGYGLIVLVIWTSRPSQRYLYWAAVAWIVLVTCLSFDGWEAMGVRVTDFRRSLWIVAAAVAAEAIVISIAQARGTLHPPHGGAGKFVGTFWGYCIWSFFQQFLLQDFVLLRLLRLLPSRSMAMAIAALMFALAHLPNPILTPLTLVWGLGACALFLRYRNLYTLAAAHAVLGVCLAITVPADALHNMRVGRGYLTYRPHTPPRLPSLSQPQ